jgi:hypothetical protein
MACHPIGSPQVTRIRIRARGAPQVANRATIRAAVAPRKEDAPAADQSAITNFAGALDLVEGDDAGAVGIEPQRQPLRGRRRLHPGGKALLPMGILGLSGTQDLREIQLIHQRQQALHRMAVQEPFTG